MIKTGHTPDILKRFDDFPVFKLFVRHVIAEDKYDLYVNSEVEPETLIMHAPPAIIFHGKVNPDETDAIVSIVEKGTWVISPDDDWDKYLTDTFRDRIKSYPRTQFDGSRLDLDHLETLTRPLPDNLRIVEIDETTVNQEMIKNQIIDKFFVNRPFLKHGFGLCLLDGDHRVQGFALTNYPLDCGNEIEVSYRIGYDDFQTYRGQGLGTTLVCMFLKMAIKKGYSPLWDAANDISAYIARKIGYVEKRAWFMHHIVG